MRNPTDLLVSFRRIYGDPILSDLQVHFMLILLIQTFSVYCILAFDILRALILFIHDMYCLQQLYPIVE